MDEEKLKRDITRAIEMAESIHDGMVAQFERESVPSEIKIPAMDLTCRLATLKWYLGHIGEGVSE